MILTMTRLLAGGLVLIAVLNVMIYWAKNYMNHTVLRPGRCVYLSIPAIIGLVMFITSFPLARWFKAHQDDDDDPSLT